MADKRPIDLEPQRTRLIEMRTQLELDLETSRQRAIDSSGGPDEPGSGQHWERSGYGDHQADEATELFEREKELGLEQTLEAHLSQVTHALQRVEDATYGQCERCGKQIAPARLNAMPEATLCIDCKAEEEQHVPAGRRQQDADPVTFNAGGAS